MKFPARSIVPIAATLGVLIALGCARSPPKATYTVDEYLGKPDVLTEKLRECTNNPGELRNDPDCINVKEAVKQQGYGSLDKLKPLKLTLPGDNAKDSKSSSK